METLLNPVAPQVEVIYNERPPNFDKILAVFPLAASPGVIFAYGDKIYVPSGKEIPPEILSHERVHCERQLNIGVEAWWDQYLADPRFRYEEELLAHKVEYSFLRGLYPGQARKQAILSHVARKLSARLYGGMVTMEQAKRALK